MTGVLRSALICALLAAPGGELRAQAAPPATETAAETAPVVFVPPAEGAPASRVGAGTRSLRAEGSRTTLLLPAGGGQTTQAQPFLVWHLAEGFAGAMQAEIADLAPGGRAAGRRLEGRFRPGFHALDLARSDMELAPGRIYRWSVILTERGSGRVLDRAEGLVERVAAPEGGDLRAAAAAGLWFDALAAVMAATLSGGARLTDPAGFAALAASAGLPGHVHAAPQE